MNQTLSEVDFLRAYLGEVIKDTKINNLSYLSMGASLSNPEMLVDSTQLKNFVNDLSDSFDAVVIDAPPLNGVIDSALIAANTDATILAIQSGLHDYRTVLAAREQLEKAGAKLIGAALCKVDKNRFKSYFRYREYCKKTNPKDSLELEQLGLIDENKEVNVLS
jgi:capsular exopolysaccharide synthesis family protein